MSPYEYASLYNEGTYNLNPSATAVYSDEQLAAFRNGKGTDWWDSTLRNSTPQSSHNISVSGGNEKTKYYLSVGHMNQSGLLKSKDWNFNRTSVRSNISVEVVKGLTVDFQMAGRYDKRTMPFNGTGLFKDVQMALPVYSIYANDNTEYRQGPENPVQMSNKDEAGFDDRVRREFNGSIGLTWQLPWVKGLIAKALVAYDYHNREEKQWGKRIVRIPMMKHQKLIRKV
ncbi:MAG: hypothetical protein LIP01_13255 [Tannerellaceae bacterium]|nr:hypothetical protein [Tannerellaceae bacterium]